uniref:Glycine-rich cell wall structural protein 1-like isoform X19 n=1 Tax=Crassostrea virginica TaxID=6565 RepID=A0A8B8EIJ3_CRAVI|nr:glycine-rich cell wall structural protein 1-like isoform X19 [Crassostrea virginica]
MSRIFIFVILCVALVASEKIRGVRRTRNIVKRQTGGGCLYEGTVYQQGQSWTVPCKYNCVCKDGTRGQYSCTEVCPHYDTLPDGCYMQKDPNSQCCSVPKCNFQPGGSGSGGNVITGTSGGDGGGGGGGTPVLQMGSGSGHSGSFMSGGTCHDTANNCVNYGQAVCSDPQYSQWVKQNCAKFCNVCGGTSGGAGVISGGGGVSGGGSGGGMVSGGGGVSGGGAGVISGGGSGGGMVSGGGGASGGGAGVISGGGSGGGMVSGGGGVSGGGTSHTDGGDGGFSLHFGTGGGSGGSGGSGIMTGTCTDAINNCAAYGTSVCSDPQYDQWVTKNCAHSCNKCGSTGTMTGGGTGTYTGTGTGTMTGTGGTGTMTGTGGTMTGTGGVPVIGSGGTIVGGGSGSTGGGGVPGTMNGGSGTMTGGGTCADKTPNCDSYGQQVCNDPTYAGWVSENCPHFCGKCSGSMTSGTGGSVYYPGGGTMTGTGGTMTGTGGTMTGTGGTMTGTGGTMTGTGGTMTGTGGSMTGTGGTMTDTGSGGTMTGTSSGCVYKHQVYQQGQTWKDGCTYSCTCTNAATGQYTCTGLCAQWNLPPSCTLNPPAAGKCCQTPNCPSNVQIQYPPGYVEQ